MKKILIILIGLASLAFGAQAAPGSLQAASPSPQSLDRLLDLMQTHKLIDNIAVQVDQMMRSASAQIADARHLSAADRAALDQQVAKIASDVRREVSWNRFRSVFVQVYSETFTQPEIDGMIAFYQTAAGKAFVEKTPLVMQRAMALMRPRIMEEVGSARGRLQAFADHLPAPPAAAKTAPTHG
ncbi:MAG: DUF2059 domain-containing protein [Opitutaceae bacterium]